MPEGPEIRRAADRLASVLEGRVVDEAFFASPVLKPWEQRLQGQHVERVHPRGKALLIRFESGVSMYSHNLLYGRWFVRDRGVRPTTGRQLRAALHTTRTSALLYSASEIDVLHDEDLEHHPYLRRLGVDPLDERTTPTLVRRRLEDSRFIKRSVGALLLDQSFLAGVGNYLRSEILSHARTAPTRRPVDLDDAERMRLARSTITIARRAYRMRGLTTDPRRIRRMAAPRRRRREERHDVFGRAGDPCRRCGDTIIRRVVSGRRLYACPTCQSWDG